MKNEHEGRRTFYDMMILEGFIAMVWAAAAMGAVNAGLTTNDMLHDSPTSVVGIVAKDMLGTIGGTIAIIGVIVLPITSGDTAMRSLRIMIADALHIDTGKKKNNLLISLPIFILVSALLIFAKSNESGFNLLWRCFSWSNETIAAFAFAVISIYMLRNGMPYLMALIPGMFYTYVCTCYILSAKIGFGLPWTAAYIISAVLTLAYGAALIWYGKRNVPHFAQA
jgi:carbon starvation protein CstA